MIEIDLMQMHVYMYTYKTKIGVRTLKYEKRFLYELNFQTVTDFAYRFFSTGNKLTDAFNDNGKYSFA